MPANAQPPIWAAAEDQFPKSRSRHPLSRLIATLMLWPDLSSTVLALSGIKAQAQQRRGDGRDHSFDTAAISTSDRLVTATAQCLA